MSSRKEPDVGADPRPAATLVILRERAGGVEVLLTIRPRHLAFMGGAAVFPGGAVSAADRDRRWADASTLSGLDAQTALNEDSADALGAYVCALRESFEEVGFLLADGPIDRLTRSEVDDPERFRARCSELGLMLRTDLLVPAGRWVTPLGAPVRFDTRFFIAAASRDWEPDPDPSEVETCHWLRPEEALERFASGELLMAPPTVETLQKLSGYAGPDEAVASLRAGSPIRDSAERLSPLVQRIVAPNPGLMTGPGTNTYVVGSDPSCVIDPAVADRDYLERIGEASGRIGCILVTHRHPDHVGGIAALLERDDVPVHAFGSEPAGGCPVRPLEDGSVVEVEGAQLRALHTPGHASDHLCFFLEGAASLFAGDNVLGQGTAVIAPPDGNMRDYLTSLKRLQNRHISRIYPGHFDPLDGGNAVLEYYLSHRRERHAAILEAVGEGAETIESVVKRVYKDTPLPLHPVAARQVQAHLDMLRDDGEVFCAGNRWFRAGVD